MNLADLLPNELRNLADPQTDLPRIAKDRKLTALIESVVREVPTHHDLRQRDARSIDLPAAGVGQVASLPNRWNYVSAGRLATCPTRRMCQHLAKLRSRPTRAPGQLGFSCCLPRAFRL